MLAAPNPATVHAALTARHAATAHARAYWPTPDTAARAARPARRTSFALVSTDRIYTDRIGPELCTLVDCTYVSLEYECNVYTSTQEEGVYTSLCSALSSPFAFCLVPCALCLVPCVGPGELPVCVCVCVCVCVWHTCTQMVCVHAPRGKDATTMFAAAHRARRFAFVSMQNTLKHTLVVLSLRA